MCKSDIYKEYFDKVEKKIVQKKKNIAVGIRKSFSIFDW